MIWNIFNQKVLVFSSKKWIISISPSSKKSNLQPYCIFHSNGYHWIFPDEVKKIRNSFGVGHEVTVVSGLDFKDIKKCKEVEYAFQKS
jgi:hypothetical protein